MPIGKFTNSVFRTDQKPVTMNYGITSVFVVMESCLTKNSSSKWGLESNFNIETLILIFILTRIWASQTFYQ